MSAQSDMEQVEDEFEALRQALRPFAELADLLPEACNGTEPVTVTLECECGCGVRQPLATLSSRDLLLARAAYLEGM